MTNIEQEKHICPYCTKEKWRTLPNNPREWDDLMMHILAQHPGQKVNNKSPIDNMSKKPKCYRKIPSFIKDTGTKIKPQKKKRPVGLLK